MPSSAEDYIRKSQYVNAGSYRARFEAANHRMWDITSGVMLWKLNSAWPTVLWQLYDWFLTPNAAYYYAKKALEPIHIQLNENDFTVSVINTQHRQQENLKAEVEVLNFDLEVKWKKEEVFTMDEDCYKELFQLPQISELSPVYFVKLRLKDRSEKVISDNFYWFSSKIPEDFRDLSTLKKLIPDLEPVLMSEGDEYVMKINVKNESDKLAFFKRLMITRGEGGEEVLPVFWDDNFFSLLPGEEKVVFARFAKTDLDGEDPVPVFDDSL